jgi:guanosine-3',5'-bis(diphosphate) 3'-pyrophosphohydrolase
LRDEAARLLAALRFAAEKHRDQRRKGRLASPYINHPIEVAETLARCGIDDLEVLQAAILHDTIEDTMTTAEELEQQFGQRVTGLVKEVTDDKRLPKQVRKQLQIEHAPVLSDRAKLIKLVDKVCNVRDMALSPPEDWPLERRVAYLDWADRVVAGCRGKNPQLDALYERAITEARERLREERALSSSAAGQLDSGGTS